MQEPGKHCRDVRVVENTPLGEHQRLVRLEHPGWDRWRPGQFVMVRGADFGLELPWARPFSIMDMDGEGLDLLVRVCGRGSVRLAAAEPGDAVTVWGPLGTSFAMEDVPTLLLAGGVGLAPFAGYVRRHENTAALRLVFGHRDPAEAYPMDRFSSIRMETHREREPKDLERFIEVLDDVIGSWPEQGLVLCCGPTPFMRTVRAFAKDRGVRCQLSFENRMACGIGACLGCVAKDSVGHHVQTCTHGPVFWADKVEV
jgi:dihydroorotate dehydrogenase electron transfer subunit